MCDCENDAPILYSNIRWARVQLTPKPFIEGGAKPLWVSPYCREAQTPARQWTARLRSDERFPGIFKRSPLAKEVPMCDCCSCSASSAAPPRREWTASIRMVEGFGLRVNDKHGSRGVSISEDGRLAVYYVGSVPVALPYKDEGGLGRYAVT